MWRSKNLATRNFNSVNLLCLIIDKINGYIKEDHENKYLTLVPTDANKEIRKTMEQSHKSYKINN